MQQPYQPKDYLLQELIVLFYLILLYPILSSFLNGSRLLPETSLLPHPGLPVGDCITSDISLSSFTRLMRGFLYWRLLFFTVFIIVIFLVCYFFLMHCRGKECPVQAPLSHAVLIYINSINNPAFRRVQNNHVDARRKVGAYYRGAVNLCLPLK